MIFCSGRAVTAALAALIAAPAIAQSSLDRAPKTPNERTAQPTAVGAPDAGWTAPASSPTEPQPPGAPPTSVPAASTSTTHQQVVVTAAPGKGLTVRAGDGFAMTVRARLQLRDTISAATKTTNEINIRTVRLLTQGHVLTPDLRYVVQLAFGVEADGIPIDLPASTLDF